MKQTLLLSSALLLASVAVHGQVIMIDFGTGTAYNGNNSPAHATGSVPNSNTSWIRLANDGANEAMSWQTSITSSLGNAGTLRYSTARAHSATQTDQADPTAQFNSINDVSAASSTPGAGIWGTDLTSNYIVDITSANRRDPVAVAIGNIIPGEYHVYLVAHHAGNLTVPLNVGYRLLGSQPTATLGFNSFTGTSTLTPSADTSVWVAGEDYIKWTVTITETIDTLVVMVNNTNNTNTGINHQATISSLQIVAVPEPSTYAALVGLLGFGFVVWRRRRQ